ncbi:MAG TPA: hypothetical protein VG407_09455 [Caulobacteraceae bacterium]|jgi:hypothetical protein|nr:hypothetical protein [Caulobacteraceae bacterium]
MRAPILVLTSILALSAVAATAAEGSKTPVGQYVDLQPVAIPVVADGKLRNYVFVSVRLNLSARADPTALRAKAPYFRDALVRTSHRTPFAIPGDWTRIDEAALKASLFRQASVLAGPGVITGVVITSSQPQRRVGMLQPRGE